MTSGLFATILKIGLLLITLALEGNFKKLMSLKKFDGFFLQRDGLSAKLMASRGGLLALEDVAAFLELLVVSLKLVSLGDSVIALLLKQN